MLIACGPLGAIRTRAAAAPAACNRTPCQENGNTVCPTGAVNATACNAESNNAGCTPKPPTPPPASGTTTSAKISSPRRHTASNP